jgi:GxxExxY protein
MQLAGIAFRRQVELPVIYRNHRLDAGFRLDLLAADEVIIEIKSVEQLLRVYEAQLLTYMRLSGKRLGLLMNFNVAHFRDGIQRKVL